VQQTVYDTVRDFTALGSDALVFNAGSAPNDQYSYDREDSEPLGKRSGTFFISFKYSHLTPPQESLDRR
jgi:hypothetical protein